MEKVIVRMDEVSLKRSYKKFQDCVVLPIINSAGRRSSHLGNLVFWNSLEKREIINSKRFNAYEWQKVLQFKRELGDKFVGITHKIYQPEHYKIKLGERELKLTDDYQGQLDEYISNHPACVGITWMDSFEVRYKDEEKFIPAGNYSVNVKEKDGKINFHFNKVENEPNALWVDYSSFENFHTEDLWTIIESVEGNYILQDTIHSGGGAHHSNLFIGILKNGTKLRHYIESYKGRQGYSETFWIVKNLALVEIPNF